MRRVAAPLSVCRKLVTSSPPLSLQGEGVKGRSTLVAFNLPILWDNRHQLKAITSEFSAMSSLMTHLQEALDLAERHWKDG